jgi:signal peptidase I
MWRHLVLREAVHLFFILAAVALLHHTVGAFEVEGASMEPTLHTREYLVVDTFLPRARLPQRGEVVIFRYPRDPQVEYVKRVVGLPGETVAVAHGRVWIDGQPLDEPYIRDLPRYIWGPGRVPTNSFFVLGDNRNSSSDSHLWGPVPVGNLVGRALLAWSPLVQWTWLSGEAPHLETVESALGSNAPAGASGREDAAGAAGLTGPARVTGGSGTAGARAS